MRMVEVILSTTHIKSGGFHHTNQSINSVVCKDFEFRIMNTYCDPILKERRSPGSNCYCLFDIHVQQAMPDTHGDEILKTFLLSHSVCTLK